jgi:hypothetical protein
MLKETGTHVIQPRVRTEQLFARYNFDQTLAKALKHKRTNPQVGQFGSSTLPDLVFYRGLPSWERSASLHLWCRWKSLQESFWPKIVPEDEYPVGYLEFCHGYNYCRGPHNPEPVQQLCTDRYAHWVLANDANVWNRDQEIPKRRDHKLTNRGTSDPSDP